MAMVLPALSQAPGAPDTNGLSPTTATFYVNSTNSINNGNTESLGLAIAKNGNVIVGWEDDGADIADIEAVWTVFDSTGNWITPDTKIDSLALGTSITNKYLSYFRPNGSATPGYVSWGPKIKANWFGDGVGHGAVGMDPMGVEITDFAAYIGNDDFPVVQLFNNAGSAAVSPVLTSISVAYAATAGSVRIGDWDYLSNGNIVIAGDSRQNDDLWALYGGTVGYQHAIYSIVTPTGAVVTTNRLIRDDVTTQVGNENIWHGVAVAKDGFAIRLNLGDGRGVTVRLFDNSGNPLTTNMSLTAITGHPQAGGGGRGDDCGFGGNGKDAYVHAASYNVDGTNGYWVTVLNTNGTVRWSRDVANDMILTGVDGGDAAINENGEVIVVFSAKADSGNLVQAVLGRRFDASGNPVGGTFFVSENEDPSNFNTSTSDAPRVAWRNGQVAIAWRSLNDPNNVLVKEVALRQFSTVPPSLKIERVGTSLKISWPANVVGYTLQSSALLGTGAFWGTVGGVVNNSVTIANPTGTQYYRLKQ